MESGDTLTEAAPRMSVRRGLAGGLVGAGLVLAVWLAEAVVGGREPVTLHTHSVAVWVVDALPFVFALAVAWRPAGSTGSRIVAPPERRSLPESSQELAHTATPAIPESTPPPVPARLAPSGPQATPPPVPARLVPDAADTSIPAGNGRTVLVVDATAEGPVVASWLADHDYRVVHVGDGASGSLAREAEEPDLALVDAGVSGAAALVGELGRHGVPLVLLGGATLNLPRRATRTARPPSQRRVGEALRELELLVREH